jgi:hypothetical protein
MTDPADVAAEANSLSAGLGIITIQIFPFALPLLLLCIAPLLPLVVVGLLLAAILYLPVKLVRYLTTRKQRSVSWTDSAEAVRSRPIRANPGPP